MKTSVVALAVFCGAACSSPGSDSPPTHASDAGTGVSLADIAGKTLDALAPAEAEFVCREDFARTDSCLELGRNMQRSGGTTDSKACVEAVAACRAQLPRSPVAPDCGGVIIAAPGTCSVTVEEYFACVDAWHGALSCDNAGYKMATPPACAGIEAACPDLASFHEDGRSPPCPADTTEPPDTNDDIVGLDTCRPKPTRLVVLGDSIADCTSVGDDEAACTPNALAAYLRSTYSPDLSLESKAVAGTHIAALPDQAALVKGGAGHVFVWIFSVGNDLLDGNLDDPTWEDSFRRVFDYFQDPARFPDGATFLLNTQYSPYDECEGGGAEEVIQRVNKRLFLDVAVARSDATTVDNFPDWLGHGEHANDSSCPHCRADNSSWVLVNHPNAAGYTHMTEKWKLAVDEMLSCPSTTPRGSK